MPNYISKLFTIEKTMEGWVGRSRADSQEIRRKSASSHVARMTGGRYLLFVQNRFI